MLFGSLPKKELVWNWASDEKLPIEREEELPKRPKISEGCGWKRLAKGAALC
jgi:hypothetical protein